HVLHDDGRISGDMLAEVSRQQTCAHVVIVAHRMADDQADLLAAIEVRRALGLRRARKATGQRQRGWRRDAHPDRHGTSHRHAGLISYRRFGTSFLTASITAGGVVYSLAISRSRCSGER